MLTHDVREASIAFIRKQKYRLSTPTEGRECSSASTH
jgi:hypothetical protein